MTTKKIFLKEDEIPRQWYNLAADLPSPLQPPLGPDGNPITPDMLAPVFPMNLIEQEVSPERWIDIPEEVLEILYRWRPSPLRRAVYLEQHLETPARIYYSALNVSPQRRVLANGGARSLLPANFWDWNARSTW
jgi:tryptophan synthase beta chain